MTVIPGNILAEFAPVQKAFGILLSPMGDLRPGLKHRFRELTYGPIAWGAWSWSFQDGSCWVALYFDGANQTAETMVAWAAVTAEVDTRPVIGCYVAETHRKKGIAELVISTLLRHLIASGKIEPEETLFAKADWFPKYPELLESLGLVYAEWV